MQNAMFHVKLVIMLVVVFVVLVKNIKVYEENSNIVLGIIVFSVLLPKRTEKCYPKDRSRLITYRYSENICIKNELWIVLYCMIFVLYSSKMTVTLYGQEIMLMFLMIRVIFFLIYHVKGRDLVSI